jgi:uncharacterized membrane protein YdbT with pleckstrin-like domain
MAAQALQEETLWKGMPSTVVLSMKVFVLAVIVIGGLLLTHWVAAQSNDLITRANLTKAGWVITALVAIAQLGAILLGYFRLRSTLYTVTNQRVIVERGMWAKSLSEIDLRTIDDTQFFQTVTDRMLGIGNVILVSTDKTAPMFVLRSIRDPRTLRETIRAHAYQVSQRQVFTRAT